MTGFQYLQKKNPLAFCSSLAKANPISVSVPTLTVRSQLSVVLRALICNSQRL